MRTFPKNAARLAILSVCVIALSVAGVVALCRYDLPAPASPVRLLPDDLAWRENPRVHGLRTAVLAGDPDAAGPYAQRIAFPAHFRLPPHSHPNEARMVTVLSGTLYFAYGDTFDEARLKALPPGSFFTEPKNMPHYAMTRDEEVVLQLNAIGPDGTHYVEEAASARHD